MDTTAERFTSVSGHTKLTHVAPSAQSWTHTHTHTGHQTGRRPLYLLCSMTLGQRCWYQDVRLPLVQVKDCCFPRATQLMALFLAPPPFLLFFLLWVQLVGR